MRRISCNSMLLAEARHRKRWRSIVFTFHEQLAACAYAFSNIQNSCTNKLPNIYCTERAGGSEPGSGRSHSVNPGADVFSDINTRGIISLSIRHGTRVSWALAQFIWRLIIVPALYAWLYGVLAGAGGIAAYRVVVMVNIMMWACCVYSNKTLWCALTHSLIHSIQCTSHIFYKYWMKINTHD